MHISPSETRANHADFLADFDIQSRCSVMIFIYIACVLLVFSSYFATY